MESVMTPPTSRQMSAATVLQRSVVLVLRCTYLGNYRNAKLTDAVRAATGRADNVDAAVERQVHLTKKLVDSRAVKRANAVPEAAKAYLRSKAIPAHRVFGERAYLVPMDAVEEVDARLAQFAAQALLEGQLVAAQWDRLVAEQREALQGLFNPKDYPTAAQVAEAWTIDWDYVSFGAPERLEHVDRALFQAAQRKFEARMADAYHEVRLVLRETLFQLVGEFAKKLTPGEDGKPKVFRNTILDGLTDFLDNFHVRNISDDAELDAVVQQLRGLTRGIAADTLRESDSVRESMLRGVQEASAVLDTLVATGRRGIALGGLD